MAEVVECRRGPKLREIEMGFIVLLLMIIGWILLLFAAFGSGLDLHLGHLTTVETAITFILAALCLGIAPTDIARPSFHRNHPKQ
jgi:hypothetical protein